MNMSLKLEIKLSGEARLLSDNSKARQMLRWEPQVGFREGLSRSIDWIRQHFD